MFLYIDPGTGMILLQLVIAGFASCNKIIPYSTNLYLYGFDKSDFEKIKNVQDLGYLINGSFFKQIK